MKKISVENHNQYKHLSAAQYENYPSSQSHKFNFMTKIFPFKKMPRISRKLGTSPQLRRVQRLKVGSPHRHAADVLLFSGFGDSNVYSKSHKEDTDKVDRIENEYNVVFFEDCEDAKQNSSDNSQADSSKKAEKVQIQSERDKMVEGMRKHHTYFEVVKVMDRGVDPYVVEEPKSVADKETDPLIPGNSQVFNWEYEKNVLVQEVEDKNEIIDCCLEEGNSLLDVIEETKRQFSTNPQVTQLLNMHVNFKKDTFAPSDYLRLSRTLLVELGEQFLEVNQQSKSNEKMIKQELLELKKEKVENEEKIKNLEHKLEVKAKQIHQETHNFKELEAKVQNLENTLQEGRKTLKDAEKGFKEKQKRTEAELILQKERNTKLSRDVDEKSKLVSQLKSNLDHLKSVLEERQEQIKKTHSSYKLKIAKLESENSHKMAALCENQSMINKQLSQTLDQSSKYVHQIQELKKETTELQAEKTFIAEKALGLERELARYKERFATAERKLSREAQEVMSLRSQVEKLEALKEEELMSVDGDTWCQIMYQQDQRVMEMLSASLQEKEKNFEALKAQGDCPLKEFERVQNELQLRRQQFTELKNILLDFERKRGIIVREQRDFYKKMLSQNEKTIAKEKFFKNLIEECQKKTEKLQDIEEKLLDTEKSVNETRKNCEGQLEAMQGNLNIAAERLYEYAKEMKAKDLDLQNLMKCYEQEKKNRITTEEAMNTYKMMLEDMKKENGQLKGKISYLEDLEKNRSNVLKVSEQLAKETEKRQDTETKLKELEKDFLDMKKEIKSRENLSASSENNSEIVSKAVDKLKTKLQDVTADKKFVERLLLESQRSKEVLQKDHEDLSKKLRHALHIMMEAKEAQDMLEVKLDQRQHLINKLQDSHADTEHQLDSLKEMMEDLRRKKDDLYRDREELLDRLKHHANCRAERSLQQELKLMQRDKAMWEEQNAREKEMLLHKLASQENIVKDQHKHLRAFQEQLDNLNTQLRETKAQLIAERHEFTQQKLDMKNDKQKLEAYTKELEARLVSHAQHGVPAGQKWISSTSDSYDSPTVNTKKYYYKK